MTQLFPQFSAPAAGQSQSLPLYRDVRMDYETGRPLWESGNPVMVTGLEAVKGWAWRAIGTARYHYPCFSWSYGCELEALTFWCLPTSRRCGCRTPVLRGAPCT